APLTAFSRRPTRETISFFNFDRTSYCQIELASRNAKRLPSGAQEMAPLPARGRRVEVTSSSVTRRSWPATAIGSVSSRMTNRRDTLLQGTPLLTFHLPFPHPYCK